MKHSLPATLVLVATLGANGAAAHQQGDILLRAGLTTIAPDASSSNLFLGDTDLGLGLDVGNDTQLGLNVAYFLTDRINVELLAATPFTHDVDFGVSDPLDTGDKLGEVTHLPPTLTVNYYFADPAASFQPYAGIGLNYTFIYDEVFTSANKEAGLSDLSLDNSLGLSAQVGADVIVDKHWHINASVRWIDIDTEATYKLGGASGSVDNIAIDPWVYTLSVGYTF